MTPSVVLATRNAHKLDEVRRILADVGIAIEIVPLPDDAPDVVESGSTFGANAVLKARSAAAHTGMPAIADDSGLCVDALNGMPGVLSARWCGRHGDDQANVNLLLAQMMDIAPLRRGAQFVCAVALVVPDTGSEQLVEGVMEGRIAEQPRGSNGFGYDPIFVPDRMSETTAQMSADQKDALSHRGQALRSMASLIAAELT